MDDLQAKLALAKGEYKTALKNLEMISDEIHERRRSSAMGPRGCGVGAEGSSTSVEDLSGSKPEPDAVSGELGAPAQGRDDAVACVVCFQSCLASMEAPQSWQAGDLALSHGFPHFAGHRIHRGATECSQSQASVVDEFGKCYTFTLPDIQSMC